MRKCEERQDGLATENSLHRMSRSGETHATGVDIRLMIVVTPNSGRCHTLRSFCRLYTWQRVRLSSFLPNTPVLAMHLLVLGAALLLPAASSALSWTATPFSPPSYPLAVRSPYLSAWLPQGAGTALNGAWPQFWTGSVCEISFSKDTAYSNGYSIDPRMGRLRERGWLVLLFPG